ncbi:MAG: nucleotidyltransferase family protein [Myxococcales bacterium]|nr:nucleotidyltransferase family protein [Myxococcales bacterium]
MIYSETLAPPGRFLCLAARSGWTEQETEEFRSLYAELGEESVRAIAKQNQMTPLVAHALERASTISERDNWSSIVEKNAERVQRLIDPLAEISERLSARGAPSAAVEAGGVMLGTQLPLGAYCSGDIDLLVPEEHWSAAKEVFEDVGFASSDRRDRPTKRAEFSRPHTVDGEQWLEVGFAPFDRMWVPLHYQDRCKTWLSRAVPSQKSRKISVLNPNDALVFVAFHTSLHSYIRAPGLRLQVDVDRLVRDCTIDWSHVVQEARLSGISTRVFVSLAMAKGLLDSPIPNEVLESLAPPKRRWNTIFRLLRRDGVIAGASPKLTRLGAILLDVLISEKSPSGWLADVIAPDSDWMREHFDRNGTIGGPSWKLHVERFKLLASRWRPE